jgi:spermidine synthase
MSTGAVGLLVEQALEKLVATVIGASTPAAAVVLAVYFSGLAIGGVAYSRFGARRGVPLLVYAVLEAFVGLWALFMRVGFDPIQASSTSLMQSTGDAPHTLFAIRFGVASLWILPPSIAMGASFPAIVGALARFPVLGDSRRTIAMFYSLNLVGAVIGTLLGAYWLMPLGGPGAALLTSFGLEVAVCAASLWLARRAGFARSVDAAPLGSEMRAKGARPATALLLALGAISGFVFFAFELVAVHLIGATVGTSAYAFADMLAAILMGMLVSGLIVTFAARRSSVVPDVVLGSVLAVGAFAVTLTTPYWADLPELFLIFRPDTFLEAEAFRFLFSSLLLVPCAIGLGGIYPLLFRLPWFSEERREALAGWLVAANASGCFFGSLTAAFILVPGIGSQRTLLLLAGLLALGALAVSLKSTAPRRYRYAIGASACLCLCFTVLQPPWDWRAVTRGTNVHFADSYTQLSSDLLFLHEDVNGGITSVVMKNGRRVLLTNGKFQGDDRGQMAAQVGFALVPLSHTPGRNEALVIGLGTGHSAAVIADAGFGHVDVAEIAPGIVLAARNVLADLNGQVLDKKNVSLHMDDGRNFVLRSHKAYDVVSMEISSVWFAGATNLYAREFYEAVRERLAPGGIFQQWVQLHHIAMPELLATVLTIRDVIPHVELYVVGGQGILIASDRELAIQANAMAQMWARPEMANHIAVLTQRYGTDFEPSRWRLYNSSDIDALHARFVDHVRNTDMNRFLEYTTPRYQLAAGFKRENILSLLALLPEHEARARRVALAPELR